jgi:hypothetical protein
LTTNKRLSALGLKEREIRRERRQQRKAVNDERGKMRDDEPFSFLSLYPEHEVLLPHRTLEPEEGEDDLASQRREKPEPHARMKAGRHQLPGSFVLVRG